MFRRRIEQANCARSWNSSKVFFWKSQDTNQNCVFTFQKLLVFRLLNKLVCPILSQTPSSYKLQIQQQKNVRFENVIHELFDFVCKLISRVRTRFCFRRSESEREHAHEFVAKFKFISKFCDYFFKVSKRKEKRKKFVWFH